MHSLVKSGDPDEMLHKAAFHQGLHYLPRQKRSSLKEIHFFFKLKPDPLICTMDHLKLLYQTKKNPLVHKAGFPQKFKNTIS